jgi:ribosomal protein L22
MEIKAIAKYIRVSPRKIRLLMREIRGKKVEEASRAMGRATRIRRRTSHLTIILDGR